MLIIHGLKDQDEVGNGKINYDMYLNCLSETPCYHYFIIEIHKRNFLSDYGKIDTIVVQMLDDKGKRYHIEIVQSVISYTAIICVELSVLL